MRLPLPRATPALSALALATFLASDLVAQRGGGLPGFINEDIPRAIQAAKETGKPLMIVFRCPP